MQERFILVWEEMVKHGLLSMECIMRRMDLRTATGSPTTCALTNAVNLFEYTLDLENNSRGRREQCPKGS